MIGSACRRLSREYEACGGHLERFIKESLLDAPCERVFAFHERPDAFALLQPPWEETRIIRPPRGLKVGTVVVLKTKLGPFWVTIEAEHVAYVANERFEDIMRRGPFAYWHHKHLFSARGAQCLLRDEIDYALPLGALGKLFGATFVRHKLERLFAFRHALTAREVTRSEAAKKQP